MIEQPKWKQHPVSFSIFLMCVFGLMTMGAVTELVYAESFVAITDSGAEIPIEYGSAGGEGGDLTQITNTLFSLQSKFEDNENEGIIIYGKGTYGTQESLKPYTLVPTDTEFAAVVLEIEPSDSETIPKFWKEYQYSGGSLVDISPPNPNILLNAKYKKMSGNPSVTQSDDGIKVTGTGTVAIKVTSTNPNILVRGELTNAIVQFVTSPLDLTSLIMSGINWIIEKTTPTYKQTAHSSYNHRHVQRGGRSYYHLHSSTSWDMVSTINTVVAEDTDLKGSFSSSKYCNDNFRGKYNCHRHGGWCHPRTCSRVHGHGFGDSGTSVFSTSNVADGIKINQQITHGNKANYPTRTHTAYATHPYNEILKHTTNFEDLYNFGSIDTYLIVKVTGGSALIKGEPSGVAASNFIEISDLTPNLAYQIEKDGLTVLSGVTDATGKIIVPSAGSVSSTVGGTLVMYPDSQTYRGAFEEIVFDDVNDNLFTPARSNGANDLLYVAQKYIRVPTGDVEVTNVAMQDKDNTKSQSVPYLSGTYAVGDYIKIPVVPTFYKITFDGDGEEVQMKYEDVGGQTGVKVANPTTNTLTQNSITSSIHSIKAEAGTVESFIATYNGDYTVKVSETISGNAQISNTYNLEQVPPPPPRPPRKDPLVGHVEIFINGEFHSTKHLGTHAFPDFTGSSSGGSTVRQSVLYQYPDYHMSGSITFPASAGDFIEVYLFAEITGEIGGYSVPRGWKLLSSSGTATATANIVSADILIP